MFSCLKGFVLCIITCGVNSILIGSLPNEQHGVSGQFYILNSKTIYIEHFNYDGGGPGAYFYYYEPNVVVTGFGGGYKIPLPPEFGQYNGQLKRSRYTNVNITVTLPDGVTACDIGTFTVWCEPFQAIFTRILIPRDIFVDNGEGDICSLLTNICLADNPCVNGVCMLGSSPDQYTCNCTGTNYMGTNCSEAKSEQQQPAECNSSSLFCKTKRIEKICQALKLRGTNPLPLRCDGV